VAAGRSASASQRLDALRLGYASLVILVSAAVIAAAAARGPFGPTGMELWATSVTFGLGFGVILLRPRPVLYALGLATLAIAFAILQPAPRAATGALLGVLSAQAAVLAGALSAALIAAAWTALWASAARWWHGVATYLGLGVWLLAIITAREGVAQLLRAFLDFEQFVFVVMAPLLLWPSFIFGMLGLFGIVFR
jgi:hypothetical protein